MRELRATCAWFDAYGYTCPKYTRALDRESGHYIAFFTGVTLNGIAGKEAVTLEKKDEKFFREKTAERRLVSETIKAKN